MVLTTIRNKLMLLAKKYFLTLGILLSVGQYIHAQERRFETINISNTWNEPKNKVKKYTVRNGLPLKAINAITQDKDGLIWLASENGLARFDGNSFKLFKNDLANPNSLSTTHIHSVFTDSEGVVWVCTSNGLNRFDPKTERFFHYKHQATDTNSLVGDNVENVAESAGGNLWIASIGAGLTYFDKKKGRFIQYSYHNLPGLSSLEVIRIYEDRLGLLWVGTLGGGMDVFKTVNGIVIKKMEELSLKNVLPTVLPSLNVRSFCPDHMGNMWIGTSAGLVFYNRERNNLQYLDKHNSALRNNSIQSLCEDSLQNLWIGVEDKGLHRIALKDFDGQSLTKVSIEHSQTTGEDYSTYKYTIAAIYQDRDHNLWLATSSDGAQMISSVKEKFVRIQRMQTGENEGVYLRFWGMCSDKEGNLWLGTDGDGIYKYNNRGDLLKHYYADGKKGSLTGNAILSAFRDHSNTLWFGTYAHGLFRYDEKTATFINYKHDTANKASLGNNDVRVIFEDSRHNLWVGCNGGGVNLLDKETKTFTRYASRNSKYSIGNIRAIIEDKRGGILVGCHGEGVHYFDPVKKSFQPYFKSSESIHSLTSIVYAIHLDKDGKLWMGTEGAGLISYDPAKRTTQQFNEKNGLGGNSAYALLADSTGSLWMSTNTGVSKWDRNKNKFYNYDASDGLQIGQFNSSSFLYDNTSGLLGFAGTEGVTIFNPGMVKQNLQQPKVMITGLQVFNKPVEVNSAARQEVELPQAINHTTEITLKHNQSVFTFEFTALNYAYPEKCKYAYKMEGFDESWNYIGSQRTATYTNLDADNYTFRVKASNEDGIWNEDGASIKIHITPPFWLTWWFMVAVALLIAGSIVGFYWIRISSVQKQKVLLEQKVSAQTIQLVQVNEEERKARIEAEQARTESDIARHETHYANEELKIKNKEVGQFAYVASHDLQEPLRTIAGFADLLHKQYHGKIDEKADKYLDFISDATTRMKTLIKDLLDFSRLGKNVELKKVDCNIVVENMMADIMAATQEAKASIQYTQLPVIVGYPTELKLLFQNLVVNAIKFRKKDVNPQIEISAQKKEGYWEFAVSDNCIGIEMQHSDRIFNIFQRLHTRSEYEGSGIGLSHCKKIVELHHGKIWMESTPGEGTTFYFTLLIHKDQLLDHADEENKAH
ncbi:MAG: two-component regulator propeller domain-containing protein [Ferruginibacter sp.]